MRRRSRDETGIDTAAKIHVLRLVVSVMGLTVWRFRNPRAGITVDVSMISVQVRAGARLDMISMAEKRLFTTPGASDGKVMRANATSTRILAAAEKCFDEYSMSRTTIEDIAAAANVSRPTIYRHFPNKDMIVDGVLMRKSARISQLVLDTMGKCNTSRERITEAMVTSVQFLASDRMTREALDAPFRDLINVTDDPAKPAAKNLVQRWLPILSAAIADGTLSPDLEIPPTVSWLTDVQMLFVVRMLALGETIETIREEIERYVLNGLAARPASSEPEVPGLRSRRRAQS